MLLVMWIPVLMKYNIAQESKAVHYQQKLHNHGAPLQLVKFSLIFFGSDA